MDEKPPPRGLTMTLNLWIPVLFLLIGLIIGLQFNITVPEEYARYTAMAILAALDSVFGALRAELSRTYNNRVFISGLIVNSALAAGLTFLGDRLDVDLSIAAVVAFGVRIFNNVAAIRRRFL
jgi:small basic protein